MAPGWLLAAAFFLASSWTGIAAERDRALLPDTKTAADSVVTFNEIMYHPAGDEGQEWLEIHNQMSVDIEISSWRIEGAGGFVVPGDTVLPAGSYLVIAAEPARLRAETGLTNIIGPLTGRLSNGGERLRLRNHNSRIMDEVEYGDGEPWPAGADGSGASLAKRARFAASSPAANWRSSLQAGGTPGLANFEEGRANPPPAVSLINRASAGRWHVPASGDSATAWLEPGYDDSNWAAGTASLGYDTGTEPATVLRNAALNKEVIDGSGAYHSNPFDVPEGGWDFTAGNVTDGSSTDEFGVNYWLGREGIAGEYFTLDLGAVIPISEIHLRNTHNTDYNDRGTDEFQIYAASQVDAAKQLVSPVLILTGRLTDVSGLASIPADVFTRTNGLAPASARFLKFVAATANNGGNNTGLNEIEVYSPVISGPDRSYSFDGTWSDASGNGFTAQALGTAFSTVVPEPIGGGQSVAFDGAGSYVRVNDPVNQDAYTISAWVKADDLTPSSMIVRTDESGPLNSWSHQLRINGEGRFQHYIFDGNGRSVTASAPIVAGRWYHVAITASSGGVIAIYINGQPSGGTMPIGSLWAEGDQWRIGSEAGSAGFFKGQIDDLAIWHEVLTPATISTLASGVSPTALGGYRGAFETDVQAALYQRNPSLYTRIPFEIENSGEIGLLTLNVQYTDGFLAYLNGVEVARRNAPAVAEWNSGALTNRADSAALIAESIDLSGMRHLLVPGRNVLALQGMNAGASDRGFLLAAELSSQVVQRESPRNVFFSEAAAVNAPRFFLELLNTGRDTAVLEGCSLLFGSGAQFRFGTNAIGAGEFLVIDGDDLGFAVEQENRCFLLGAAGEVLDALMLGSELRARIIPALEANWFYAAKETPGAVNDIVLRDEIVINEIMYHHPPRYASDEVPFIENEEQWIELYNRSTITVDLSGWSLDGEARFRFLSGTVLEPDAYLVVARDAAALRAKYPGIGITGNFEGRLARRAGELILRDANGNPADEMTYYNSFPWPSYANGGGSSLELRDPRGDNSAAESWGASRESDKAQWKHYTYRMHSVRPVYTPGIFNFHEFRMGLLDEGEALIDNITVTELPPTSRPRQLIQNSSFAGGAARWRVMGNHSHSTVIADGTNDVLHLIATGPRSYMDNRLETTLKFGGALVPVVTGREYEVSFDAKWLAGSPQFHSELYYNKIAKKTILKMPEQAGTPGRKNSISVTNAGPVYGRLSHHPVIPAASQPVEVRVHAHDPDGVDSLNLFYSVNDGAWRSVAMTRDEGASTRFIGTIPGQASRAVIQFYVRGSDQLGAVSDYPGRGENSRALIKVDSVRRIANKQTFRIIMTEADSRWMHAATNMMSDELLGCTVIHNEEEVFYDARVRMHGSMFSRVSPDTTGFTVKFPADHLFRGSRESVIVRRRGMVETLVKHILNQAGGVPANYDDLVYVVSHRSDNIGNARLNLANYDDTYIDSQFEDNDDGTVFKLEGIREYQVTAGGGAEDYKLSQPIGWIQSFDIANLGDDPEQYRWSIMIQNARRRDDYSRVVAMAKAFSLTGTALRQAVAETIDVDQWARLFAIQNALGIGDVYGVENPHNFVMYARPDDGRMAPLQNDWEFAFALPSSASIYGSMNVYKVLRLPGYRRLYQGHLLDLTETVINQSYLTRWASHYTALTGESYSGVPGYAASRANSIRSQLAARIPFEITSNSGDGFSVDTTSVQIEGRGWIDVRRIRLTGAAADLPLEWLDDQRWRVTLPLRPGTNTFGFEAYDFRGRVVGNDAIWVNSSADDSAQRDSLRLSEIMYHPALPDAAEQAAGFTDENDFEFLELVNIGTRPIALAGARFVTGIEFSFSDGTMLEFGPSQRVLIVKNKAAFTERYGAGLPVAGEYSGSLSNSGEVLRLVDAAGVTIFEVSFGDSTPWPEAADGTGRSLELVNPLASAQDASNWRASAGAQGSPGVSGMNPAIEAELMGSQVRLRFNANEGESYTIYARSDLSAGEWTIVKQYPAVPSATVHEFNEETIGGQRFYRLSSP